MHPVLKLALLILSALCSPLLAQSSTGPTRADINALDTRLDSAEATLAKDRPTRRYLSGPATAFRAMRARCERGEDAAAGFIGDSTFRNGAAVPYQFATKIAARYSTHRVELRQAANNMQSITTTVIQAGPSGRRYRSFPTGTLYGPQLPFARARADFDGTTHIRWEVEVSFPAALLTSGLTNAQTFLMGQGTSGNCTMLYMASNGYPVLQQRNQAGGVTTMFPTAPITWTADVPQRIRVDAQATNGSVCLHNWWRSSDQGASWTRIGAADQDETATTFGKEGSSMFWLGLRGTTVAGGMGFRIYHAQVGIGSTFDPILPERLDIWSHIAGQIANTSALGGSPTIYVDQAAQDGATLESGGFFSGSGAADFPTEAYRCWIDHAPDFVAIVSSHNDTSIWGTDWETAMDNAVTAVNARYAFDPPIVHMTQNPEAYNDSGELSIQHNRRQPDIALYAAKKGRPLIDRYQAYIDANDSSLTLGAGDVHPSSSGYAFEGIVVFDSWLDGTTAILSGLPN